MPASAVNRCTRPSQLNRTMALELFTGLVTPSSPSVSMCQSSAIDFRNSDAVFNQRSSWLWDSSATASSSKTDS